MNVIDTVRPILFFDGVCNLCNRTVQFIIRNDKEKQFFFATLQSNAGKQALGNLTAPADSVVLFYEGKYYVRSSAALHVCRLLGGRWQLLYAFIVIPRFIRDACYSLIARNRYKWFGRRNECMLPTPELQARFLT